MKKIGLVGAAVAVITTVAVTPADAHWRGGGFGGPGIGFGIAAGALAAGAYGAYGPYGYGPGYGPGYAYGPAYAYGPGYAYGGPYYGHRR
ncbi:hypothetical protein ACT4MK_00900 (plasmid) [Bradyrhizobium barranii]|uniref:hypothetical protein n=1 Tax=Bradyrhizobium TaxID=374 RepID=UPI00339871D2